ncbi:MAG TPA: caspase family protein [Thermoanaerobaculia bacterium]|nr:caspase family protein [Thermoanaerobaculia bacterium]
MASNPSPNYRAVLIGIDDYTQRPLWGCVNDIDQIERILLDRLKVPAGRITRFAAPRAGAASTSRLPSRRPTRDELRSFLDSLAEEVGPDDAVFLYYSGHGSRVTAEVNGQRISREALVPVDCWNDDDPQRHRLLYDYELNGLLARIAGKAGDLTVVLDCCHSASVDRGEGERQVEISETQQLPPQALPGGGLAKDASGMASAAAAHMLVAACRANESAYEAKPDKDWPRQQGAFSRTLVQILDALDQPLESLRWWDIAIALTDRLKALADANRPQSPMIAGHEGRRVFGGPWARRDLGYALSQNGESFRIGAGTLTGLSEGAEVAVYGPEPGRFPILNSPQDHAARIGLLRVDKAERSSCTAVSVDGGFELPQGARGRLVSSGEPDHLTVALDPFDEQLAASLAAWGIVGAPPGTPAEARLRRQNGQLHLGDEIYGVGGQPPLASFPGNLPGLAEVVLDHYARYCQALRLPARCRDLAGALEVKLLDCPERQISPEDLQAPGFSELPSGGPWRYKVQEGDGFVIRIGNSAKDPLHVFVLNCAGSGRVEHLGSAQIPAGAMHVLWDSRQLGIPFYPTLATERAEMVERLIVVGTTLPDQDLSYLELDNSFAEVIARFPDREFGTRSLSPLVEKWTAEMVTVRIYK